MFSFLRPATRPAAPRPAQGRVLGWPVLVAVLLWALLGWSLAYWAALWWGRAEPPAALPTAAASALAPDAELVALGLGGGTPTAVAVALAPAPVPEGLRLLGVATDPRGGAGVALLVTSAAPVQMLRVGQALADGWVLQSVSATEAVLLAPDGQSGERRLRLAAPQPVAGLAQVGAQTVAPGGGVQGGVQGGMQGATEGGLRSRLQPQ
ncbi:MAG: hypothetical protein KGZ61_02195 [Sandarakinorhabdus sp.]|nr:hypothetical protein [Sandarakinorhabdus sp.]